MPAKTPFVAVMHLGQLAVHQGGRAHDLAAIDLADRLVAKANPKDRHVAAGALDELEANAGAVRIARSGRQHDGLRSFGQHLVDGHLVVTVDAGRRAQFAEEMHEVVGEAVVVIDERQHDGLLRPGRSARQGEALAPARRADRSA